MKKMIQTALILGLGLSISVGLVGCEEGPDDEGPAEELGKVIDEAGQETGEAIGEAAEELGEDMQDAGEEVEEESEENLGEDDLGRENEPGIEEEIEQSP